MKHIFLAERFGDQEYTVNGVCYIVGSCFQSSKVPTNPTIHDRFKRIVSSHSVELSISDKDHTITAEYVCSAAGKEDN